MKFADHLGKGVWGLADKALPVVYGVAYVVLVIRQLPEAEFGNFVLVQEVFLIISGLATSFALYPLLKYAAEEKTDRRQVIGAALILNISFLVVASLLVVAVREPFAVVLNSDRLAPLLLYLPAMLSASFIRNFTLVLLQTRFRVAQIFWTDAAHFLGAPLLMIIYAKLGVFDSALDLVIINIISLSVSSIVGLILSLPMLTFTLKPSVGEIKRLLDYGKYSLGGLVSYLFYTKADSFILSAFTGPVHVAVYNSVKVFIRVYDMMAQIIQMFVLPAASRLSAKGEFTQLKVMVEKAILFATVAMVPFLLLFLAFSSPLVRIYGDKYVDAIPLLQMFSVLSFIVPLIAVASSVLMGLGHAKENFVLNLKMLIISIVVYSALIPGLGTFGATIGYVIASFASAWLSAKEMNRFVPVTPAETLHRTNDLTMFIKSRLMR